MKHTDRIARMKSSTVTVVGLGKSNLPLIDFLIRHDIFPVCRDQKDESTLGAVAHDLRARGLTLVLGDAYLSELDEDFIFRSPGLRPNLAEFVRAVQNGSVLTSEMELFFDLTPATVIGITGSDGKTTTTTLTGLLLETECKKSGHGRTFVGGNIGAPLLPLVETMTPDDYAVVELSSFQLSTMKRSPHICCVTNVTPNHLNWHTDMEEYIDAKKNIWRHAPAHALVVNEGNDVTLEMGRAFPHTVTYFSFEKHTPKGFSLQDGDCAVYAREGTIYCYDGGGEAPILSIGDILLPGKHNVENYMAAIALTHGLVSKETIREVATSFGGVPHRLERVRVVDGVTYYNSSIDSTPSRTAAALSALSERPIVICGGYDKHIPFEPLAEALCRRALAVVLTGATADRIEQALFEHQEVKNGTLPVLKRSLFADAVMAAKELARPGDIVLLSPACASFDAFSNFEERGDTFCRLVNEF